MRGFKLILSVILIIAVTSTFFISSPKYHAESSSDAFKLRELGILTYSPADYNKDGTINDIDFNSYTTRNASLFDIINIMLKLLNKDKAASAYNGADPVPDGEPPSFEHAHSIITYIIEHPEYGFSTYFTGNYGASLNSMGNSAGPNSAVVSSNLLYKALLIALGYKEGTDFNNSNILTKAESAGFTNVIDESSITYNELSRVVFESLNMEKKDGEILSLFLARNNPYFNEKAVKLGLVSFFPAVLPAFDGGTLIVDSYYTQTLEHPDGSGKYTEWEARYENVNLSETETYKEKLSNAGWKVEAVYEKSSGSGSEKTTDRFYVFSITHNSTNYFAVLTYNESTKNAHLWLAA